MIRQSHNMRLVHFKVRFADGTDYTDALYANGHHQVEVVVEVLKQVLGKKGVWSQASLTDSERASVKIVPVSIADNASVGSGWSCDTQKNEYDPGLWNRTGEELGESLPNNTVVDAGVEIVRRYMRLEENVSLKAVQFMATIVLDGETVTNSYSEYPTDFKSSVFIKPTVPPVLLSTELDLIVDYDALNITGLLDIDMYYWEGVNGLWFVHNYGLNESVEVPNEGTSFQTSYGLSGNYKGGVFSGSSSSTLRLSMVHQYLPVVNPGEDPVIHRISNRVMCAVKLTTQIPDLPHEVLNSKWRLRDNYGNLHVFKIVPYESGNRLTVEPVKLARRPQHFHIVLANGQDSTDALYANGRHQCKVLIEVTMVQEGINGNWESTLLREDEKASVAVTLYSPNVNQPLPGGWSCDTVKNIHDTGLWIREIQDAEEGGIGENTTQQKSGALDTIEIVERFMRLETGASMESRRLMAKIIIDGKVYTTNFNEGDSKFNAWVNISPRQPYRVRVRDLILTVDHAYWNHNTKTDIDVWYWLPPPGVRFISQMGLDAPMWVPWEGRYFQTSFVNGSGGVDRKGGVVVGHDKPGSSPSLDEIHENLSDNYHILRFNRVNTIMRALWVSIELPMFEGEGNTPWRLVDNYGCMHVYTMRGSRQNIELLDYES